jgi:hypothetical protein
LVGIGEMASPYGGKKVLETIPVLPDGRTRSLFGWYAFE